jgi:murein L,D-transpeptidase YcbB/YkuD
MFKKLFLLSILLLFVFSCKKENEITSIDDSLIKSEDSNTVIRPIPNEKLESLSDSLQLYYSKLNNLEIWYDQENRNDLINEIKLCYNEGLNPDDYNFDKIQKLEAKRENLKDDEIINYDILLTRSFQKLASDLYKGKLDPKVLYEDWDITKEEVALSPLLEKNIKSHTIASTFKSLKPQHFIYNQIKKSLYLLEQYPEYRFKKINLNDKIEVNDTLDEIISIKKRLAYWKDYRIKDSIITPVYDSLTFEAVKRFQLRHGLKPDGVIGKGTIKAFNYSKNERREQIIANLERWRWFPKNLGEEYLLVNLPNYNLVYVVNNDTVSTNRVVIGTPKRKTPILSSHISNFVFNPTWTVPPTIIKEDLTPAAKKDIGYFERTKISIFDKEGNQIEPTDWKPEKSKSYRYVQAASYDNSLGLVKLNFPNRHAVYLHDTNHRDYFVKEYRALSSGCVRIENPLQLTEKILLKEDEKWTTAEIDSLIVRKKTKVVSLKNSKINVYLFYWTSWLDKNNKLQFREDVYNLDKDLFQQLRN